MTHDARDRQDGHDGDTSADGYHRLLDALGGHVAICALDLLQSSPMGVGDLSRRIPRSDRYEIDEVLDRMEGLGLVERTDETDKTRYRLTAIGQSALFPLRGLRIWAITSYAQAVAYAEAKESLRRHRMV